MEKNVIRIATDFDRFPYGRYPEHGPANGQRFREEFLVPRLRASEQFTVDLDGARGLGPSFLEEAFGGLVRVGFPKDVIWSLITLKSEEDPSFIVETHEYVDEAEAEVTN